MSKETEQAYILQCKDHIGDPEAMEYLTGRGFTESEIAALGFGYDPLKHRIVIPWKGSNFYHIDRAIRDDIEPKYIKPSSDAVGSQPIYNPDAFNDDAFFIVEGAIDALAVEVCGYSAIAIGGGKLSQDNLDVMQYSARYSMAIVMLDNDDTGNRNQQPLIEELEQNGIRAIGCQLFDEYKDAGEWMKADRDSLKAFLKDHYDNREYLYRGKEKRALEAKLSALNVKHPLGVALKLATDEKIEPVATGLQSLDDALGGGLYPGLYVLGAVSSLGKTTLATQIADHIAASRRGVLFVTIEQSVNEIVAKSVSRYAYKLSGGAVSLSTLEILRNTGNLDSGKARTFIDACDAYTKSTAESLRIMEGYNQPKVEDIKKAALLIDLLDGQPPVIFVDYLQLLAPQSDHDTDKRAVDKNVMALRQLSRDMKVPVFVISSLNRSSYSTGITLESFKESGAIEYSADVLLGLQPEGLGGELDITDEKKQRRTANKAMKEHKGSLERECEIVILKNRNGITPEDGLPVIFKPVSSLFKDREKTGITAFI